MRKRTHNFRPFHLSELWDDNPSEFTQEIARAYCEDRPLYRPNTSILKVLAKWFVIIAVVYCCFYFLTILLSRIINSSFFSGSAILLKFVKTERESIMLFPSVCTIITACLISRWLVIDCIKLYQRYAPEHIRRRCIMMPSCSEFAILALKRYGLILGCIMAYYRVNYRCRGTINRIEYP